MEKINKRIIEWLKDMGVQQNDTPSFPKDEQFILGINLLFEELLELVESANTQLKEKCLSKMKEQLQNCINKSKDSENDFTAFRDALCDLHVVYMNMIYFSKTEGMIDEDLDEVMDSNESKFDTTKEDAEKTAQKYKEQGIETKTFEVRNNKFATKRTSDWKILKSINFKSPNLK